MTHGRLATDNTGQVNEMMPPVAACSTAGQCDAHAEILRGHSMSPQQENEDVPVGVPFYLYGNIANAYIFDLLLVAGQAYDVQPTTRFSAASEAVFLSLLSRNYQIRLGNTLPNNPTSFHDITYRPTNSLP